MSAIEIMRSIGRPIAYHPALAKHVGGVNAAIFLCQLIYWDEKADNPDLGVYKTSEEWEEETGLSYREQAGARKKLRDLGLLIETRQRIHHRIYYKLDHAAFDSLMASVASIDKTETCPTTKAHFPNDENAIRERQKRNSGTTQSAIREQPKAQLGNDENAIRYIDRDYTETTTETTAERARTPRATRLAPDWTLPDDWLNWALAEQPSWQPADVIRIAEQFRDYWLAKGGADARKVDWGATWRNWVRRERQSPARTTNVRPPTARPSAYEQGMAAAERAKAMIFGDTHEAC